MRKPERFKIVKIPTDNPTGIDIFSSQKILSLNSQICAANWMWDEWEKYHKWFVKEKCILKEDLPSEQEIEKILPPHLHGRRIRKMVAKIVAEKIGKEV